MQETIGWTDRCAQRLGWLDLDSGRRVNQPVLRGIVAFHLLALLAGVPWLFSWSGLAWTLFGVYLFGTLGINIGFHRLITHRGFTCPLWLEHALSILGVCCWQGTPMKWVAVHRMHHQHSDLATDPHTPQSSFFWSHMGWFLVYDPGLYNMGTYDRYARDLFQDRLYKQLEKPRYWRRVQYAQWLFFAATGAIAGALASGTWLGSLQLSLSWLVWGVVLRTVLVWHITWSVNSATHLWGYRNYQTRDDSRNNWLVGLLANGEGWHNNHHAQPRAAAHGHMPWELDVSFWTIRLLKLCGLAGNLVLPKPHRLEEDDLDDQNVEDGPARPAQAA